MTARSDEKIICPHCGKAHDIGEIEMAYAFPDDYFALPEVERARRGRITPDFCQLDRRCFIRAVIPVPMLDCAQPYCWGAWIEMSQEHFMIAYTTWEDDDVSYLPRLTGRLANRLHEYEASKGLIGELELKEDTRPFFYVLEDSALKQDQHLGITCDDAVRYYHNVGQPLAHA